MSRFGHHNITATLPIAYFGRVDYYAAMGACAKVVVDDTLRYDKRQKSTHRLTVADTHGIKDLTVPVSKPDGVKGPLRWSDITLSRHGQWWHVIEETLASAYGRTPFFEFYIDRLRRFFAPTTVDEYHDVATLCRESDRAVRAILGLDNEVIYASTLPAANQLPTTTTKPSDSLTLTSLSPTSYTTAAAADHSSAVAAAALHQPAAIACRQVEYYQVRHDKFGFLPNLSILDLIFNMGPESPIILKSMTL